MRDRESKNSVESKLKGYENIFFVGVAGGTFEAIERNLPDCSWHVIIVSIS